MKESYDNNEIIDFWIEDSILIAVYKVQDVDLSIAKRATHQRLTFINNTFYPIIVDYTRVKSTSKEAREYFASEEASKYITAMAIIVHSLLGRLIVNFYLNINNPKFPTKIFNKKEEAVFWLNNSALS